MEIKKTTQSWETIANTKDLRKEKSFVLLLLCEVWLTVASQSPSLIDICCLFVQNRKALYNIHLTARGVIAKLFIMQIYMDILKTELGSSGGQKQTSCIQTLLCRLVSVKANTFFLWSGSSSNVLKVRAKTELYTLGMEEIHSSDNCEIFMKTFHTLKKMTATCSRSCHVV